MSFDGLGAACDLELSDDGSSSVISETEKRQVSCFGRRRTPGAKQRQSSSVSSTQFPLPIVNNGSKRAHSSPLPAYPVSIRQQLAIIKQMEKPATDSSSVSLQLPQSSSASPGLSRKRISKVHKKNERGETPLHVAARKGEHRLCRKLIEEGALINARDYAGWTPLHEACYHGHFKVAKLLLGYDADVNALSDCDDTPLHDAVTSGNEKLVWLLLQAGAIRDRVDNDGKKPIDICHSDYPGIRNLLSTAIVPELYPIDESPSLSPSSPSHTQGSSQMLSVNVIQLTPEKQCLTSPNSDDSVVSTETYPTERTIGTIEELRMQLQGSCNQPMNEGEDAIKSTKTHDFDDVVSRDEVVKAGIRHNLDDTDSSFPTHRSLWPEERSEKMKTVGLHTGSSPYEFDSDLTSSHISFENTCFGISESKETEIRHLGRPRGTHTERFSPQYTSQKSTYNEKRKQRGRRRGRGISTIVGSAAITAQTSQSDDVYEFRSSPESDVGVNKTGSAEDMERELSESPSLKRQRFSQTGTTTEASFTSTTISSQTSTTQDGISMLEKEESLDVISNLSDLMDEKSDATVGRKVPPLRISLPRTPTEGISIESATDDVASVTTSAVRRNTRSAKSLTRKHQSPEPSTSSTCDESIQRITRSKLRQSGRQLRDHPVVSYETSAKRKSSNWRRNSAVAASPMLPPSAATSDEQTTSSNDAADRADADESSHLEATAQKDDENTLLALSLMKKNSYEGRWAKDATEETVIPENPPNFNNYMIVQGNATSASSLGAVSIQEMSCFSEHVIISLVALNSKKQLLKVDVAFMEKLTTKLRTLYIEQEERRRNMQIYHQVERERLRMQAESEVMRMLTRKANEGHESFSAKTNVFNTGFLEVRPKKLPVMEIPEIKLKYEKLAETMRKRQQMEADALHAEQVFIWNAAVQKSEDVTLSSLKNAVPRVSVSSLVLNL
uniref:ANK_REP_REGION domain-containing protein n=1 Tax=Elaeophora elaphi TaxID=1147741 RepID=A0A0R3RFC6_9BILA